MTLFTVFQTFEGPMMAVEISTITHVIVDPSEKNAAVEVCHLYAGPRRLCEVRAELDDVLEAIRNAR